MRIINTLFAVRSRMTQVKCNFKTQFNQNIFCSLGCNEAENQQHLLECQYILNELQDKTVLSECEYTDVFCNDNRQIEIVKIFNEILNIRKQLIEI